MLKVYNSISHNKEEFIPIKDKQVNMYVCGVTVYDLCHLGHARAYVVFDIIRRALKFLGYQVKYIQNFTDVDDKILDRANQNKIDPSLLTEEMIKEYFTDMDALNINRADAYPRVTGMIKEIILFIEELVAKGFAYQIKGDVYFDISKFKDYGKFAHRDPQDLLAGARVKVNDGKKNPHDFVLWKSDLKSEMSWDSPWGKGRPGWHIECSVMSRELLGDSFDIHGGGQDLVFPHHQNEIAQTEALTGKKMANYWIHNGFVRIDNEKMSKSLGNFFTIREVLKHYEPMDLRLFFLMTHYRMPINYSDAELEQAKKANKKILNALNNFKAQAMNSEDNYDVTEYLNEFTKAMEDDFNTARALAVVFELIKILNKTNSQLVFNLLRQILEVLGLEYSNYKLEDSVYNVPDKIISLAEKRWQAKLSKDWAKADQLRAELLALGYTMKDLKDEYLLEKV